MKRCRVPRAAPVCRRHPKAPQDAAVAAPRAPTISWARAPAALSDGGARDDYQNRPFYRRPNSWQPLYRRQGMIDRDTWGVKTVLAGFQRSFNNLALFFAVILRITTICYFLVAAKAAILANRAPTTYCVRQRTAFPQPMTGFQQAGTGPVSWGLRPSPEGARPRTGPDGTAGPLPGGRNRGCPPRCRRAARCYWLMNSTRYSTVAGERSAFRSPVISTQ